MKYTQINERERERIHEGRINKQTIKQTAFMMKRHLSTIYREKKRNSNEGKPYNARIAQNKRNDRSKRPRITKLEKNDELRYYVIAKLREGWTPEQISGRLKRDYPTQKEFHISTKAIYNYIYSDKNLALKLYKYLPRKHKENKCHKTRPKANSGAYAGKKSIHDRPEFKTKEDKIGCWEGDLIIGKNHKGAILTLTEMYSGYVLIKKVANKEAETVTQAIIEAFNGRDKKLKLYNLCLDNGTEFSWYKTLEYHLGIDVYFADVASPYQRGSNENTNGLIRRYLPKKTEFINIFQKKLDWIAHFLNNKPRKRLDFSTPCEVLEYQNRYL